MADDPIEKLRRRLEPPPAPKRGYGGVTVPPRPELRSSPANETTHVGVAPPAQDSAPMSPVGPQEPRIGSVESTFKNFPPPPVEAPQAPQSGPKRSLSPSPDSAAFQVKGGDVDFRVSKGTWARIRPYVLWVAIPLGGLVVGYYQGLKAAGARMRAAEANTAALRGEFAELRATHDQKLNSQAATLARDGVVAGDHEAKLNDLKPRVELLEKRLTDLAKQKAIIVQPSP